MTTPFFAASPKRVLVAFTGRARAGKDTAAQAVGVALEKNGHRWVTMHFADPLKEAATAVQRTLELPITKDRLLLQVLGTQWGRATHPDFWVHIFIDRFAQVLKETPDASVLVADVRFPNEVAALRRLGFLIVRIRRPALDSVIDPHESEHALDDVDIDPTIINPAPMFEPTEQTPHNAQLIASLKAFHGDVIDVLELFFPLLGA